MKEAVADAVEDGIATTQRSLKQARQVAEDLVAITDAALEVVQDEDIAYRIAGLFFMRLLAVSDPKTADDLLTACAGPIH